jgi:hypothetical protein
MIQIIKFRKMKEIKSMSRRGQVQYFLESAFRIGFLMVALLAFFLLINFYITNRIDTNRLQSEVTANRIMYSDAIMWQDSATSQIYTGIIDLNQFNENILNSKINYATTRHAAVKLVIKDNKEGIEKYTTYLNRGDYEKLDAILGKQGKGSATRYIKNYPITYKNGTEYKYGTLIMDIIIPNS